MVPVCSQMANNSSIVFPSDKGKIVNVSESITVFYIIAELLVIFLSTLALIVFMKCRQLSMQVRVLSLSAMVNNVTIGCSTLMLVVVLRYAANSSITICRFAYTMTKMAYMSYCFLFTIIGLDRLFALRYAIRYQVWISRRRIYTILAVVYALGLGLSVIDYASYTYRASCVQASLLTRPGLTVYVTAITISFVTSVTTYSTVGVIVLLRRKKELSVKKHISSFCVLTFKVYMHTIILFIFIAPNCVVRTVMYFDFDRKQEYNDVFRITTGLLTFHQILSPILTILSFHESRYQLIRIMCSCNEEIRQRYHRKYRDHYSTFEIATVTEKLDDNRIPEAAMRGSHCQGSNKVIPIEHSSTRAIPTLPMMPIMEVNTPVICCDVMADNSKNIQLMDILPPTSIALGSLDNMNDVKPSFTELSISDSVSESRS